MTKSQKKHLRYLVGIAYDRELGVALDWLFEIYQQWKIGEIEAWDVNEEIHKHHNGISRELYNRYAYPDPCLLVARAISRRCSQAGRGKRGLSCIARIGS